MDFHFFQGVKEWCKIYFTPKGHSHYPYDTDDLTRHMYVCGLSGTGKSTYIQQLLIRESVKVPYLVVEPTRSQEYRRLKSVCNNRKFEIYTLGVDEGKKIDLNPFYIPFGMDFTGHVELLKSCFADALTCKEPLVYQYLERAIPEVYFDKGWDRITFTHPYLLSKDDYQSDEHWYYFPRMQDLYDKVVELSENSEFTEGSENKGTIRELVKSNLRTFLSGPMGRSFNTYRNELLSVRDNNVVIEIPNTISTTLQAILNMLLASIVEVIGSHKKSKNLSHITVFEEAQLLFNAEDDDKIHKTTARKLEYLLSTSRKFGESIIITNQDPKAIHRSVIGNISNRIVFRINHSDIAECIAKDFRRKVKKITSLPRYKYWGKREGYASWRYDSDKVDLGEETTFESVYTKPDYNIACSGLDNFNEQLQIIETYIKNSLVGVNSLKNAMADCLKSLCNIDNLDLDKYLAYLTCICIANNRCRLVKGVYDQLTAYFKTPNAPLPKEFIESGILEESVIQRISKKMLDHDRCNNKR